MLTVTELKALRQIDHARVLSDGGSLRGFVHAAKDGRVSVHFKFAYKFAGKQRAFHCGTWPDSTLKEIRDARDAARAIIATGTDPIGQREQARHEAQRQQQAAQLKAEADHQQAMHEQRQRLQSLAAMQTRLNVRDLFERWQRLELSKRDDAGAEVLRSFSADVFPLIGGMAAEDVTKAHIREILDNILSRATPAQPMIRTQKKTLSDLRQMFAFAIDRDMLETDPTARLKKKDIGKDGERDRVLTEVELIALFQKLPESGMGGTSRLALLIQLSTVARIGEVLGAAWANVDMERKTWTMPTTKNGKAHTVHLSDFAMTQFQSLHESTGLTKWCFPASRTDGPVCPKTVTKQAADRQRTSPPMQGRSQQTQALMLPGGQWRPHDLRRTGATMMAELGTLPDVVERCLNHTEENKMKRIYQRAQYDAPMRDAWQVLGQRLALLHDQADGKASNVVTLHRAA